MKTASERQQQTQRISTKGAIASAFVDQRAVATVQRQWQLAANASPESQRLMALQRIATDTTQLMDRPSFNADAKKAAFLRHNFNDESTFQVNVSRPGLPGHNAAMPHRMAYKTIRDHVHAYRDGDHDKAQFSEWTDALVRAGEAKVEDTRQKQLNVPPTLPKRAGLLKELLKRQLKSQQDFKNKVANFKGSRSEADGNALIKTANSLHANVPDLGPHMGVNNPVQDKLHLNLEFKEEKAKKGDTAPRKRRRSPSPTSREMLNLSPGLASRVAVTADGKIITTSGQTVDPKELAQHYQKRIKLHGVAVVKGYDENFGFGNVAKAAKSANAPAKAKAKTKAKKKAKTTAKTTARGRARTRK